MHEIYRKINELLEKGETFAVVTIVKTEGSTPRKAGARMIVLPDGKTFGTIGGDCVEAGAVAEALEALKEGKPKTFTVALKEEELGGIGMKCGGMAEVYIEVINPRPKLLIIGGGNIGAQLAKLGHDIGFEVTVIDPAVKKENLPEYVKVIPEPVENGVKMVEITRQTYVVIATGHKYDEDALKAVINSNATYIGMVGSKRKAAVTLKKLIEEGFAEDKVKTVHTPVGLDIGAETPEEIAVSIMAEIIKERRKPGATGNSLKISF
ncbi:MAG: XdhC family protein [Candidatus Hadarchaeum sp.]|uniref:XdhC family protein n=1 Tax=Candidatus Hadarchaeum sp. TaxID=2883567 RepID=UPI003D0C9E9C